MILFTEGLTTNFLGTDFDHRLHRFDPESLPLGAQRSGQMDLSAGDFDNDGYTDLAVTQQNSLLQVPSNKSTNLVTLSEQLRGSVHIVWSPALQDASIVLSADPADLDGDGLVDVARDEAAMDDAAFGGLPISTSQDLDHDGFDDLLISASDADALDHAVRTNAGAVYRSLILI